MTGQKSPPSEMIRVPTALIGAVRRLSHLHRQGHTIALLQGLKELISKFDSNLDIDVTPEGKSIKQMGKRLETKLEVITKKLEQIEQVIASGRYNSVSPRKQAYSYEQPQVELQPKANEKLAPRLGISPQSLIVTREELSTQDFLNWTRNRDPSSTAWKWNDKTKLYYPVK